MKLKDLPGVQGPNSLRVAVNIEYQALVERARGIIAQGQFTAAGSGECRKIEIEPGGGREHVMSFMRKPNLVGQGVLFPLAKLGIRFARQGEKR